MNKNLPIFVETSTTVLRQMLGPYSNQSPQTMRSFDVTNGTNYDHWWRLKNGHRLDNFFLVNFYKVKKIVRN